MSQSLIEAAAEVVFRRQMEAAVNGTAQAVLDTWADAVDVMVAVRVKRPDGNGTDTAAGFIGDDRPTDAENRNAAITLAEEAFTAMHAGLERQMRANEEEE